LTFDIVAGLLLLFNDDDDESNVGVGVAEVATTDAGCELLLLLLFVVENEVIFIILFRTE